MDDSTPKKTGRETLYRPEYVELVRNLSLLGHTEQEIAKHMGIARSTLSSWKLAHPEFKEALKRAKEIPDAQVLGAIFQSAIGAETYEDKVINGNVVRLTTKHAPNVMAGMYWLNNRQRQKFSRNPDPVQVDTPPPEKITVEVVDASIPDAEA